MSLLTDPPVTDQNSQPNVDEPRRNARRVVAFGLILVVLLASVVTIAAFTGTEESASAAGSSGALPISDEESASRVVPPAPATTLKPLIPIAEAPPEGQLVATAKVKVGEVAIWSSPTEDEPEWLLPVPTEFFGDRHFLVLAESNDWLKIAVPVRPNETVGWIPADDVTLSSTNFRVQISVSGRSVKVWEGDELVVDTSAAVGRDNAPTPLGSYYIRDILPWYEDSAYGPYVLALSAYSEVIDVINGGEAVVAIHGTSRPELIGQAVSLGCIRLDNEDIRLVAETVPVGTPVEIVA
jgi:lipoprotein-anchoring transpeptidase ErfK/SrfK